jgi:hypothetical protein
MRSIKILGKALGSEDTKALAALAAEAGCSPDEIEVVESVGEPDPDCDDEIVLVLASPAACADPDLEAELAAAQRGGRRAICIWPLSGEVTAEPPPAAQKYAYSIVPWDATKLRAVAADDDVLCFETAAGAPLPKPETERHVCVEEKAKPK